MGLSNGQRDDIRNFLLSRGLAFKPLLDEMSDHVACDLENLMDNGLSYEDAWKKTINDLPENHFKEIQQETMGTINKRFTLSRVFTYVGMAALFIAAAFKVFHLQGADEALLMSLGALAIALLTSSVAGIYFNRDKNGALRVLTIVVGVILLMIGYAFKILHLPGADQLVGLSIVTLLAGMIVNTVFVYNHSSGNGNLFTFLHEKYSPGIERFLLIMSAVVIIVRLFAVGLVLIELVVIVAAGLQFTALCWTSMEKNPSKNNTVTLIAVIVAFTCTTVPMLGQMVAFDIRLALVTFFSFVGVFLSFRLDSSTKVSSYLILVIPMVKIGWMNSFASNIPLNVVVVGLMIAGIALSPKTSVSRTFMILSLSGYILELDTIL
jgi:hypothetical protein